ncbi:MAG: hypothetical protein HC880_02665 [Bacteroidia bacterium]|nr:hypothetical protein [Bacteroidia bacterium]
MPTLILAQQVPGRWTPDPSSDVIVMKDGELIRARVLEIGIDVIKYQRADQINGPIYSVFREQVASVSYGDNTYDYLEDSPYFRDRDDDDENKSWQSYFEQGNQFYIGLGFIENFSKIENIEGDYTRTNSAVPSLVLGYQVPIVNQLQVGVQLGFGRYNYEGGEFRSFDQALLESEVDERITTLTAYARYTADLGPLNPLRARRISHQPFLFDHRPETGNPGRRANGHHYQQSPQHQPGYYAERRGRPVLK